MHSTHYIKPKEIHLIKEKQIKQKLGSLEGL